MSAQRRTNLIKKVMKTRFLLAFISLWLFSTLLVSAQTPATYVEVRASASQEVTPNKIEIAISLNEADSKGKVTLKTQQDALAQALCNAGIDAKQSLVIVSQSSQAAKRSNTYQYINYLLTVSSAEELRLVFEEFASQGVSGVRVQRVANDSIEQVTSQLRAEAMQKAQRIARELAQAVGQSIGAALTIEYYSNSDEVSSYTTGALLMRSNTMGQDSVPELPADLGIRPISVRESVEVKFALL